MAYSSGDARLNGSHPIKTSYHFYQQAISRNKNLEVDHLDTIGRINVSKLEKEYDVVLLPRISIAASLALRGIRDCRIPVIAQARDPQESLVHDTIGMADDLKVDCFFDFYAPFSFYEYYPERFRYKVVHIGLEPSLYEKEAPWAERVPDRIAISGALDKPDIAHKLYYRVYLRRPKALSSDYHYRLRTKCSRLPYVIHTQEVSPGQSTEQLPKVLSMFRSAIAAVTTHPTIKFKETPAAGCLTFMEITERNHGSFLGYEDGKSSIFIDESNYKERFQEYLDSPDDPKWETIAQAGRQHALENLSNDRGVEMLVNIMRKELGEEDA